MVRNALKANPSLDYSLIIVVTILNMVGVMMIFSTTFYLSIEKYDQPFYYLFRQFIWLLLGVIALVFMSRIEYHVWGRYSVHLLALTIFMLFLVIIIAEEQFGGRRWLLNGSIQPSELAKLTFMIYLAHWLASKGDRVKQLRYGLLPYAILMSIVVGLVVMQQDLSTAVLIAATTLTMFFVAGGQIRQLFVIGVISGATFITLVVQSTYRMDRLRGFFDPLNNTLDQNYQIQQILIALGSGGLFGLGPGQGRQKFGAIPAAHTDGIFAIIGEEFGLIGCLFVISLFAFLAYRGFKISVTAKDSFGVILAAGITCNLLYQALLNIGVITATLPFTGIPLPFISFGGSSLVSSMASIGLLLAISRRTQPNLQPQTGAGPKSYATSHLRRWDRGARVPRAGRRSNA